MWSEANTETIPTLFLWTHGGSEVSLSGSFVKWVLRIPMTPVEGNPTVFRVIYPLVPGHHEYKFCVDGEWRHDERQPFVNGSLGYVNTVSLRKELGNDPAENGRLLSEITMNSEGIPRILETELEMTRRHVLTFLSTHAAFEMLPESGKVIALDVNITVKQAFHILYEQGIPVAPLWDFQKGLFVGVLSALDFILILMELGHNGSNLTEEELERHTISAWKKGKVYPNNLIHGSRRSQPRLLVQAGPYDSLKDVALKILQNNVASLPIIHSASFDGSYPELLHIASLSDVLKCICQYFRYSFSSLPIFQQPICSITLGTWVPEIGESSGQSFHVLSQNATLNAALSTLVQANISSVPVVDEKDALVDIYSRSDITALAKNKAYAQIRLNEISIHQALQLGQDTSSPDGHFHSQRCQMCLRSDPLYKVMERLANPGVRRLVIVEAGSRRVEGIVSLSDIFRLLLS